MGFRFRKSLKIAPGVRVNIGSKGISSFSVGRKGARVNISKKGTRTTVGLPGTGISYSSYSKHAQKPQQKVQQISNTPDYSNPDHFLGYPKSEWKLALAIGIIMFFLIIWIFS